MGQDSKEVQKVKWFFKNDVDQCPAVGRMHRVMMKVDFGSGSTEIKGVMYYVPLEKEYGGPALVFADEGGWCTEHVIQWRLL